MSEINDTEEIPEGNFPVDLKLIQKYQREEPRITAKYKYGMYHKGYFYGGSNIDLKLITCTDKIIITPIIQSYVVHWYDMYLLHPGMDRSEATINQHLYWPDIRYSVRKEVKNCDIPQRTKQLNNKVVNYQLS